MKTDGEKFLAELAVFAANTFEANFSHMARRLGLGAALSRGELIFLYAASFQAALCNIAFNGLGGCRGQIKPELEGNRTRLEVDFMAVRDLLFASSGWRNLPRACRGTVQRSLLHVWVKTEKLAV